MVDVGFEGRERPLCKTIVRNACVDHMLQYCMMFGAKQICLAWIGSSFPVAIFIAVIEHESHKHLLLVLKSIKLPVLSNIAADDRHSQLAYSPSRW